MSAQPYKEIAHNGIWKQNTSLVQLLGLCPLLAVSTTFVNGVSLAIATIFVMALASGVVASVRSFIPREIRIPVFILIIAALVTMVDLAMNAWLHELYLVLDIFIPLIVVNCIVLARVKAFAAKNTPLVAAWDGAMMGIGMVVAIAVLGPAQLIAPACCSPARDGGPRHPRPAVLRKTIRASSPPSCRPIPRISFHDCRAQLAGCRHSRRLSIPLSRR
jgi:Na+-translocating ferredoxin:NAD+ oxidoreductase RnfE subunit